MTPLYCGEHGVVLKYRKPERNRSIPREVLRFNVTGQTDREREDRQMDGPDRGTNLLHRLIVENME